MDKKIKNERWTWERKNHTRSRKVKFDESRRMKKRKKRDGMQAFFHLGAWCGMQLVECLDLMDASYKTSTGRKEGRKDLEILCSRLREGICWV